VPLGAREEQDVFAFAAEWGKHYYELQLAKGTMKKFLVMAALVAAATRPAAWCIAARRMAAALGVAVALAAGPAQTKPADRLPELVEVSGLNKAFDGAAAALKEFARKALKGFASSAFHDRIVAGIDPAIDAAFAAAALRGEFLRVIDGELDDDDIDIIMAFDRSPFGARMIAMEIAAIEREPDAVAKMAEELKEELKNDPERAEVLTQMEHSLQAAEVWTDQTFNVGRALFIGLASVNADMMLSPDDIETIDQRLAEQRPAVAADFRRNAVSLMAYIYHDASVSDLRDYLAFLNSPTGRKYYAVMVPAMKQVYIQAGNEFGWALMRELGKAPR
jgi:hypothetical protein